MKNYTSSVPVEVTVMRIEKLLVKYGATKVAKEYVAGEVAALTFTIMEPKTQREMRIHLPVKPKSVAKVLIAQYTKLQSGTERRIQEQSARTAWKLMQDWVEVQLSLIEMEQAEFVQIFLPYLYDGKRTYYESLKEEGFKLLGEGKKEKV